MSGPLVVTPGAVLASGSQRAVQHGSRTRRAVVVAAANGAHDGTAATPGRSTKKTFASPRSKGPLSASRGTARRSGRVPGFVPHAIRDVSSELSKDDGGNTGASDAVATGSGAKTPPPTAGTATFTPTAPPSASPKQLSKEKEAPTVPSYVSSLAQRTGPIVGKREIFFEESYDIAIREYLPSDVRVDVQSNGVSFKVTVETDSAADLVLHWGVASVKNPDTWTMPPNAILPNGTNMLAEVCQTPLTRVPVRDDGVGNSSSSSKQSSGKQSKQSGDSPKSFARVVIEGAVEHAPHALNFVLHDKKYNQWYHQQSGDFFRVLTPALPEPEEPEEEEEELEVAVDFDDAESAVAKTNVLSPVDAAAAAAVVALETPSSKTAASSKKEKTDSGPKGIASLLGTLSSFKRNVDVKKEEEKKLADAIEEVEKAAAAVAAAVGVTDSAFTSDDDDDDDAYTLPVKAQKDSKKEQKRRVAKLLQERAAFVEAGSKGKESGKRRPRIGLFGLRGKKGGLGTSVSVSSTAASVDTDVAEGETPVVTPLKSPPSTPALPTEVDWFAFQEQHHVVFTEVDVHTQVGILVDVERDAPGASARVRVETDLPGDDLLLHWGVVPRGARADMWTVPAPPMRPEGSKVYGDKALQTPMTKSVSGLGGAFAFVELDMGSAPGGLRFVIKENGGRDRWFDDYGGDFVVPLPEQALSSNFVSPPSGRSGLASPFPGVPTLNRDTSSGSPGSRLEEAQLALGGAAAATFSNTLPGEKIDEKLEECIRLASVAFAAAQEATRVAEQATAAAKDLPEDGVASTKARRLIAQAEQAKEQARITAFAAHTAALRARAANDPSGAAAAAADAKIAEDAEVAEMASRAWAGETAEISDDTLQRWRDDMELTVTKEAEAAAAEAESAARRMRTEFLATQAERERVEAVARAEAEAEASIRVQKAAAAEAIRVQQELVDRAERGEGAPPPAWLAGDPGKAGKGASASTDAVASTGAPPLPNAPGFAPPADVAPFTPTASPVAPGVPLQSSPERQIAESTLAPQTPQRAVGDRVQNPTGNGKEMLIQGFNWESARKKGRWYQTVTDLAPRLKELGFTTIWLPPPTNSVSEEGYMPQDLYDLNSKYGSVEDLKQCVAALHEHGIKTLGDAVLNHRCAGLQGPDGLWNQYTGKLDWDARAIVSDDPHFGGKGNRSSGDFFHAAPNIDHSQDFVKNDIIEWMRWLQREVGYDGWRLDYVRGFSGTHVKTYMESTDVHFAVGEYWDTLSYDYDQPQYNQDEHRQRIISWIDDAGGLAGAFDVTTKGVLHAVFERQEYWRLSDSDGNPPGVLGRWPSRAVTFIENHDTGSTQGHWRFPGGYEQQGYVYILTHPGTPTVFWDHVFEWAEDPLLGETIEKLIRFRDERGVNARSVCKILKAEQSVYAAQIDDSLVMKIGPGAFSPADEDWEYHTHGIEWCLWRRKGT